MNQLLTKSLLGLLIFFSGMFSSAQNFEQKAIPLEGDASLDKLILTAANKELVLLGKASHSTHEHYLWRDKISRRLIAENDFSFIAVGGDFAGLNHLNRYVKNLNGAVSSAKEVLLKLNRWPSWGAPMKEMTIPPAISNSIEYKLNQIDQEKFYMIFDEEDRKEKDLKAMGNRAVGVVYNPRQDKRQFEPTIVQFRYDALFFFNKTTALRVLKR